MIRTKGEPGTGDIVEAVKHMRTVQEEIRHVQSLRSDELMVFAKESGAPYDLVKEVHETGRLPVVNFAAGGVATPADAALMMMLGADGDFRRLGHVQVQRPGPPGQGHRRSDEALERPRNAGPHLAGAGRGHDRHFLAPASGWRSAWPSAAREPVSPVGIHGFQAVDYSTGMSEKD